VSAAGDSVAGVSELVLEVADLARAEDFYSGQLGLPVVERWPHRDAIWVLAGMTRIGLWRPQVGLEGSRGGEHVHFAMRIADGEFDAKVAALRAHGHDVPVHEFGPLSDGAPQSRSAYVHDPDGHLVEFWTADMQDYGIH
jgi:catechol 2,3-dioxygenase-like lactoylglutathione lyase family enzyme